jgi:UDP-N-acetylglucosamine 2-epimerase
MKRILSVIGTRPEAIKMAPVIKALVEHPGQVLSIVCVTGQHRQLLDPVLKLFSITADCDLNVMRPNQGLSQLTAALFSGLDAAVAEFKPNWILAQGDTTSVMVAALVAYYHRIPFGHVEAGLRTDSLSRPFPEEANRRIADTLAELMFAPTAASRQRLLHEGAPEHKVVVTGNTIVDALHSVLALPFEWSHESLASLPKGKRWVLITAHRRESFGEPLHEICRAVRDLACMFEPDDIHFIYPVHLNPHVQQTVADVLVGLSNVSLLKPLDYPAMVHLMKRSILVMTDSGGVQEEAPSLGVPVLVLRETTERPEGVEAGVARIVGTRRHQIVHETELLLRHPEILGAMVTPVTPYGDGHAAARIVSRLLSDNCTPCRSHPAGGRTPSRPHDHHPLSPRLLQLRKEEGRC